MEAFPKPFGPLVPTPVEEPTAGPLPLTGRGHPVASVEIIGQFVAESGPVGALHLAEVIRYSDGTKPDIVGYDPEGSGFAHGGDRLFAETSLGGMTPEHYIAAGRKNYHLEIKATPHQTLDEFVAHQEHSLKMYDRSHGVPRYDAAGHDVTLHNSNGAMVASIREAGRGDVADRLQDDLEPPDEMRKLERSGMTPEAAGMILAVQRRQAGQPSAPGALHELTAQQIRGLATPEPMDRSFDRGLRQANSLFQAADTLLVDAIHKYGRASDNNGLQRTTANITVVRTDAHGAQTLQRMREPFEQSGTIRSVDAERVVQDIGRGQTFTYQTAELLHSAHDRNRALRFLEQAAANHEFAAIKLGTAGLEVTTKSIEHGRSGEYGR